MKKAICVLLSALMLSGSLAACSPSTPKATPAPGGSEAKPAAGATLPTGGKTLTIYSWNDEFKKMFEDFYLKDHPLPAGVTLEYIINPNDDGVYQQKLDAALQNKESIDLYLIEADYAKKYVNSDSSVPLADLGITEEAMAKQQYPYTIEVARSSENVIKGSSWQAAPGLFFYRRSLAEKYLGTSDPTKVQEQLKDWDTFLATARKVSTDSKGETKLFPSIGDIWQVVRTKRESPWVVDDKLVIDKQVEWYMDLAKTVEQEKLSASADPWAESWNAGINNNSIMGYFFSTWGVQWVMTGNSGGTKPGEGSYGDWAAVPGPQPYYWGGTWLTVAPTCDNADIVKDIIEYFTINYDSMRNYCITSKDYVNNKEVIDSIIKNGEVDKSGAGFSFDFLGGQDHYSLFQQAATGIDLRAMSGYDQDINIALTAEVTAYSRGVKDKEQALKDFKAAVSDKFPEITAK